MALLRRSEALWRVPHPRAPTLARALSGVNGAYGPMRARAARALQLGTGGVIVVASRCGRREVDECSQPIAPSIRRLRFARGCVWISSGRRLRCEMPDDPPDEPGGGPVADADRLQSWRTLSLGAFLGLVGLLLVGLLISAWPAVEKATAPANASRQAANAVESEFKMSFFGLAHMNVTAGTSLLIVVGIFGAMGSFIHAATSFVEYVGNR